MSDSILVLNAGSSSLKFALYEAEGMNSLCRGEVDRIGAGARLSVSGPKAGVFDGALPPPHECDHEGVAAWLLDAIRQQPRLDLKVAGHRVVHGGRDYALPILLNERVITELAALTPLAPAHQPHNLAAIRSVEQAWPGLPQVACFDTAFHRTQPRLAQLFPIPHALSAEGILRYGFHGLSYQHIAETLPALAGTRAAGRVVAAHLGQGASLCGMRNGHSVATTMGFTALDGLMMGTRSGAVDPGLVLHLIRERGMEAADVADLLNNRSGLLGVSGISRDVRDLLASSNPRAAEALDLFAYRAIREIGSLIAALGGLDLLVFTAGVGENAPSIREAICTGLSWAGVALDPARNASGKGRISADRAAVDVWVVAANEELPIARAARALLGQL